MSYMNNNNLMAFSDRVATGTLTISVGVPAFDYNKLNPRFGTEGATPTR